jgi:hypothetical protein
MTQPLNVADEILNEEEAAQFMRRSVSWLRRSNVPVAILPGRGEGKRAGARLYLRSELLAYVRRYLTHSVTDDVVEPRPPGTASPSRVRRSA